MIVERYWDLYEAIWGQAIKDDMLQVVEQLYNYAFNRVYRHHAAISEKPIFKDDNMFDETREDIYGYCEMKARKMDMKIRELIFEEAQNWPMETVNKGEGYKSMFNELKSDVREYVDYTYIREG